MTNLVIFFWSFLLAVAMSIEKEDMEALIKANNDNLLASFNGLLEQTVSRIKRSNEDSAESQMKEIKRLKFNESHKFKKKANEDQFKFNQKLSETLDSAKSAAENLQLEKVKTSLEEGETLISERQKHILLADKSDYGWATVDEYKKHSLADDSDDEKRIFKAKSRARTFVNALKKKKSSAPAESTISSQPRPIPALVPGFSPRPKPGTCFVCGKSGHWRASCPTMVQQNTSIKWLADRHNSGVVLSSVNIEASSLPSQSELGSAIDSDPSVAACADSFLLDSLKDSDSLAVDLSCPSVRGRLGEFVDFWRTLEVSQFVLNVIMQGYKIPFFQLPTSNTFC